MNSQKLSRLIQPGMALYFCLLFAFAAVTFFFGDFYLALGEAAVGLLLLLYFKINAMRRRREISAYIQTATDTLETAAKGEMPFPMALVKLGTGEIVWSNDLFHTATGAKSASLFTSRITDYCPTLNFDWLQAGQAESPYDVSLRDRTYRVMGNIVRTEHGAEHVLLATVYFIDITELSHVKQEYIRSRPVVGIILVDNYDDLTNNMPENGISNLNVAIHDRIATWTDGVGGLLRKIERNRYLFLFEAKDLPAMVEKKFSLLETMRQVKNPAGIPATVSIGIGKDGANYTESFSFATLGIEMALARGGDQAVIKDRYNFAFYGGHTVTADRRTKVKSRVVAGSLSELIRQSTHVFVMGHKNADLDSVGAAAGMVCICRKLGKRVRIVLDLQENAAGALIAQLQQQPEYEGVFVSGQEALLMADSKSLLIVVDTNRPDQVQSKPLLESIIRVCVVDHHRRAADYIEKVVLNLHEPFASSASELVTELLQYTVEAGDILPVEAQALLSGIVLDTKNFGVRTGSRTFEAAAYLRKLGADPADIKKLLKSDLADTLSRYEIIKSAKIYRENIAVAALDYTVSRVLAAQAADELLSIQGVECSFVMFPMDTQIIISARSLGDINVQMILEPLGGGGNPAMAGAQISGKQMSAVITELVSSIDQYFED
ncbi:MAG: DHH family phosphoesterase [Oscillospiraceae bacterium]|nr:DHH family phosphoesterase [Oscillospiraceae bacterium]